MPRINKQKVIAAMSGGVDSSVAAALLKREGFDVIGIFMNLWLPSASDSLIGNWNRCYSLEAEKRARDVALKLRIPFYVFDLRKEFKRKTVDSFLAGYRQGITPNPCVVCNKEIKFGLLLEKALALGADYVATGHYARKTEARDERQRVNYKLLKARDKNKDQSYFLWTLNQNQLKRILFPIGDLKRKEVEKLAIKFKLTPVFGVKKSFEICFIQTTINDFLARYLKKKPGKIVSSTNIKQKVIGQHQGLWFYTIGQRKGIRLPGGPYYVLEKKSKENLLIVTKNEKDLYKKELQAKNVNWIGGREPKFPLKVEAKIRYKHKAAPASITKRLKAGRCKLIFDKAQRAITPGQSVVFYKGQEVLGGGVIC